MSEPTIRVLRVRNAWATRCEVLLEPWGMPVPLEAGAVLEIEVHVDAGGDDSAQVDVGDGVITVFHGVGARIVVKLDGNVAYSTLDGPTVPGVPEGMSMSGFMKMMFKPGR